MVVLGCGRIFRQDAFSSASERWQVIFLYFRRSTNGFSGYIASVDNLRIYNPIVLIFFARAKVVTAVIVQV